MMHIQFVRRCDPGAERGGEIFALRRTKHTLHLVHLDIAGAEIVEDGDAKEEASGLFRREVFARATDDKAKFQFVVHALRIVRPRDLLLMSDERQGVALVVDGHFVVLFWHARQNFRKGIEQVSLECQTIAHHRRIKRGEPARMFYGQRYLIALNKGNSSHDRLKKYWPGSNGRAHA